MNKNLQRWIPAAAVPVAIAAVVIAVPSAADATPPLPEKTAQQVLDLVATSAGTAYSGTVEQTSDLGLPDLSALGSTGGDAATSAVELLTGSHSARVFVGGADTQRVQVLDSLAERDAIRNGDSVWLYDSDGKQATHLTADLDAELPAGSAFTPAEASARLLAAIDPSTTVDVIDTARIAGRPAYQLRLTPKDADTLVGTVTLSVDAETGLPLAASITAKGADDPAFSVGFSSISFETPDASLFDFTPPSDAEVTEKTGPDKSGTAPDATRLPDATTPAAPRPTVVGDGWDAVAILPAGTAPADVDADATGILNQLTSKVDGGRALETSLLSVFVADDGRVLVGAVGTAALQAAAAAQ